MPRIAPATSRPTVGAANSRGTGVLGVNIYNNVKGLRAQAFLPEKTKNGPTAIQLTASQKTTTAGNFRVSVGGKNIDVKVPRGELNAPYIATEIARKLHAMSDDYLVEVKLGKQSNAPGSSTSAEVVIWKEVRG